MVIAEAHGMLHPNAQGVSIFFPVYYYDAYFFDYWTDYRENMDFSIDTQWDEFILAYQEEFPQYMFGGPYQPENEFPGDGENEVSLTPDLMSTEFVGSCEEDTHYASHWQITTSQGNYITPLFDSGVDTENLGEITVPYGVLSLNTTYYWRVRHADNWGFWSTWSVETSFETIASSVPSQPSNISPVSSGIDISLTTTLKSADFSDPDTNDTHAASRWQISTVSGVYDSPVFDSGIDDNNLIGIAIASGYLNSSWYASMNPSQNPYMGAKVEGMRKKRGDI